MVGIFLKSSPGNECAGLWRMCSISLPALKTGDDTASSEIGCELVDDASYEISYVNPVPILLYFCFKPEGMM